jgi:hypothetical protein
MSNRKHRLRGRGKRLVDCSVVCKKAGQVDFNVWPRKGESDNEACLRRAKLFVPGNHCEILRARGINGLKPIMGATKVGRIVRE